MTPRWLYRWYDADGVLLYLGMTALPEFREQTHRRESWWVWYAARCASLRLEQQCSWRDAQAAESAAIIAEAPVFDRKHAEDPGARILAYLLSRGVASEDAVALLAADELRRDRQRARVRQSYARAAGRRPVLTVDD